MVSIAILSKLSREDMLKRIIPGAGFKLLKGVRVIETPTHVRLGVYEDVALLLEDTQLATITWGLGYDEVWGPEEVKACEIDISSDEFSIRLYEEGAREPWAKAWYPVEALKRAKKLVLPFKRDTNEEWRRHYYHVYALAGKMGSQTTAFIGVGPMIMVGEKNAVLIWPIGTKPYEFLSNLPKRGMGPFWNEETPEWLEEAVERWARELGVIE